MIYDDNYYMMITIYDDNYYPVMIYDDNMTG